MLIKEMINCNTVLTDMFTFTDDLIINDFVFSDGEILTCNIELWSNESRASFPADLVALGMLSADKKSIVFDFVKFNNSYQDGRRDAVWWNGRNYDELTITATATEPTAEPEPKFITLDLENSTVEPTPLPFIKDFTETFIVKAKDGFFINSIFLSFHSQVNEFDKIQLNITELSISGDSKIALINTADLVGLDGYSKATLQGFLFQGLTVGTDTKPYLYDNLLNRNTGLYSVNITEKIVDFSKTLIITADVGMKIDTAIIGFKLDRRAGSGVEYDLMLMNFLNADETELNIPLGDFIIATGRTESYFKRMLLQYLIVTTIEKIDGNTDDFKANSFIKSYKADDEVLNNISNLMYTGTDGIQGDLMNTIETIYSLPFKIDVNLVVPTKRKIYFGAFESPVESNILKANTLVYDLGTIEVPKIYDSVFDYKNTECILHLPYLEPTDIDVFKVVGCKVQCLLYIDVYTGKGTYIITSDSISNNLILKQVVQVGYEIPVLNKSMSMVINNLKDYIYNLDYLFKIEVNRNKPIININDNSNLVYDDIINYVGNVKVKDLELNSKASFTEKEDIKNLLSQGIIIK